MYIAQHNALAQLTTEVVVPDVLLQEMSDVIYSTPILEDWVKKLNEGCEEHITYKIVCDEYGQYKARKDIRC